MVDSDYDHGFEIIASNTNQCRECIIEMPSQYCP